jgi:hypothetical protein
MVHKDNMDRINREKSRIAAIEERCQEAIREILDEENLDARIVFYPGTRNRKLDIEVAGS